jgi:predicted ribonuclease YlaK
MNEPHLLGEYLNECKVIIPLVVLEELDNLNHKDNATKAYYARRGIKEINKHLNHKNIVFDNTEDASLKNDNLILNIAKENDSSILTIDLAMKMKAKFKGIEIEKYESKDNRNSDSQYKGYQILELDLSDDMDSFLLSSMYSGTIELEEYEDLELMENEYLIIKDLENSKYIDAFKYKGGKLLKVEPKNLNSQHFGKVRAKDMVQTIAIDNLFSNQIKTVKGRAGSGKTFLSLAYCFNQLQSGKRDKVIFFVNPAASRNSVELGFYPGSRLEKILDTNVGTMLGAKFGGKEGLLRAVEDGNIEILPFADIRGYDSTGQNAIIYILESQNLDIELMKNGLQRVGEDCEVIIDGDSETQVDKDAYANGNNGMKRMSEVFRGSDLYGEVELKTIYRSKIANLADMM